MNTSQPRPPRLAAWFLDKFVDSSVAYAVLGDFEEIFRHKATSKGLLVAKIWYWFEVAKSFPPFLVDLCYWSFVMLKSQFSISFRSGRKHAGFSIMTMLGLSVGIASCLLIGAFVRDELSFDRHYDNANQIFRVGVETPGPEGSISSAATPRPLAELLGDQFPEIHTVARLSKERAESVTVVSGTESHTEIGFVFADSNIFDVFSIPLQQGIPGKVLSAPFSVVITPSTAEKYFGLEDPIGQTLTVRLRGDGDLFSYQVTGVTADLPSQSHFHFDFLASYQQHPFATADDGTERADWSDSDVYTYVQLNENVISETLESKIVGVVGDQLRLQVERNQPGSTLGDGDSPKLFLQALTDIHLRSDLANEFEQNGDIRTVVFFVLVALLILFLACVNYVNLTTARASTRTKEIGIRKVLGSYRRQLVQFFLTESWIQVSIATILALGMFWMILPWFNSFSGKDIQLTAQSVLEISPYLAVITVIVGIMAGVYPALVLSSFQPAKALKGGKNDRGMKGSLLRNGLVVFQFSVAVGLMITTVVMQRQMAFMRSADLGFDKEQVLVIDGTQGLKQQTESFRRELLKLPGIISVAHAESVPGRSIGSSMFVEQGQDSSTEVELSRMYAGFDYPETLNLKLAEGRTFSLDHATDSTAVLLNQAAVKALGITNPLGKIIVRQGNDRIYTVIGVVEDYHFQSMYSEIEPLAIIGPDPFYENRPRQLFIARIAMEDVEQTVGQIAKTWGSFTSEIPFSASFLEAEYDANYQADQNVGRAFGLFTAVALLMALFGLFGLATYAAQVRISEIGVRRVFGASSYQIVWLMVWDFTRFVLISFVIAIPIAFVLMQKWLEDFPFRIAISVGMIGTIILITLASAIIAVSYQSVKAARVPPIDSLKYQ
ncbi:MAG: ABC transporter permease [Bacteroidetes bacterium]|nr:ABC transporter permease [Bacteroidota bacterium]